ncbi:hypothetical protein ACFSHT_00690 [Paraburkholderia silviterrae]|uniref:Phage integrase family protein n=1 Tax=Paraburkholderia silviterrae TaxID=2528715 RepID=A0A4R5MGY3_9BURK|nr:hypothetical protein [Paraburkholderia silviterrae]TDG26136.1 hypothetical protein EYW47_01910 [Paraburkholderia silviterrae]
MKRHEALAPVKNPAEKALIPRRAQCEGELVRQPDTAFDTMLFERVLQQASRDAPKIKTLRWHDLAHVATSRLIDKGLHPTKVASITRPPQHANVEAIYPPQTRKPVASPGLEELRNERLRRSSPANDRQMEPLSRSALDLERKAHPSPKSIIRGVAHAAVVSR